jgi:hypothetical protein
MFVMWSFQPLLACVCVSHVTGRDSPPRSLTKTPTKTDFLKPKNRPKPTTVPKARTNKPTNLHGGQVIKVVEAGPVLLVKAAQEQVGLVGPPPQRRRQLWWW